MSVEIKITKYFVTAAGDDIVPSHAYTVKDVEKFATVLPGLVEGIDQHVADLTKELEIEIREMTEEEIEAYQAREDDDTFGDLDISEC